MPVANERIGHIIDFHRRGFRRLRHRWQDLLRALRDVDSPGQFVAFPSFEIHSSADGDRAIVYKHLEGELIYPATVEQLHAQLRRWNQTGHNATALPHHIGYRKGLRGINWDSFDEQVSPVVEVYSMHGASETSEGPVPYLHSMGPADCMSTVQYGLARGHVFGFCANTDHHSAHPGSYGQGMTGVWATTCKRDALWDAIAARRTFALTGNKLEVDFELDGTPMGGIRSPGPFKCLRAVVTGGAAIDYLDIVQRDRMLRRFSPVDMVPELQGSDALGSELQSVVHLEVGWGARGKRQDWEVEFGISDGFIDAVEPRFRGPDLPSPLQDAETADQEAACRAPLSQCERMSARHVRFLTVTRGNPATTTAGTQGVSLLVWARINGVRLSGGPAGHVIDEIALPPAAVNESLRCGVDQTIRV